MNKVYTYFSEVDYQHVADQWSMISHWKQSWAKRGWSPHVLGIEDARKHPMFSEFEERVLQLPTVNTVQYETACYFRWLAVAAAGGGFMSDYDVVNYGFIPRSPASDLVIYEATYNTDYVTPSVVGGSAYGFLSACMAFCLPRPEEITSEHNGRPHASDMHIMQTMFKRSLYVIAPIVRQYGHEGWDTADLVHYSHITTENTDRVQCMRTARPI